MNQWWGDERLTLKSLADTKFKFNPWTSLYKYNKEVEHLEQGVTKDLIYIKINN